MDRGKSWLVKSAVLSELSKTDPNAIWKNVHSLCGNRLGQWVWRRGCLVSLRIAVTRAETRGSVSCLSIPELSTDPGLRLGRACGSAPALAPSTRNSRSLPSKPRVLRAEPGRLAQPTACCHRPGGAELPSRSLGVLGREYHRYLPTVRKAPPPTFREQFDIGSSGQAAGSQLEASACARSP